jgi:hypothetical protein
MHERLMVGELLRDMSRGRLDMMTEYSPGGTARQRFNLHPSPKFLFDPGLTGATP